MKIAYTNEEYKNAKSNDKLKLECEYCQKIFLKRKAKITFCLTRKNNLCKYCSVSCQNLGHRTGKSGFCHTCKKEVYRAKKEASKSKSGYLFCSHSCATTHHNTNKTCGTQVSKLELWLQNQLTTIYPDLTIFYNNISTINSELDIYIPSLRLAFELNGIFHYEPIFGQDKLDKTKNNDKRKFQACIEHGIDLCVIDSSRQKKFTEKSSIIYLDIIISIIDSRLKEALAV